MARKNVVFGFLGTQLDYAGKTNRWAKWRPTVSLCQQEDLVVDKLVLFHDNRSHQLFKTVKKDIAQISPETEVVSELMNLQDPWDFEEVYGALYDFLHQQNFQTDQEQYFAHVTTGTHVAQICLFLLIESHKLPGKLIQTSPKNRSQPDQQTGSHQIIDLDLSKYDKLATRFTEE